MSELVSSSDDVGPKAIADPESTAAQERRVDLLRQIAFAGGTIAPVPSPHAEHGYEFPAKGDDVRRNLKVLSRSGYLEERFFDRVSLCPKCDSHHLNVREICPSCRRAHLSSEGLFHHFRCGYVGLPSEFNSTKDGGYLCPKCNGKMHHLGMEYDRLGKAYACQGCGLISENPPVEAVCFTCGVRSPAEDLVSTDVYSYVLTSRGAEARRSGLLFDSDDEIVLVVDAPVYRRTVIIEFINNEMKRSQHFKTPFSILLAKLLRLQPDPGSDLALTQWLIRLRNCLREYDVIGQVGDVLYVAVLPQTKRRAAEALHQKLVAELGSQSPFTFDIAEISEPSQLAQTLAGLLPQGN